jgi:hypothetical protein
MTAQDTNASRLANEYLRLGGSRKAVLDDNAVSVRIWESEPQEASDFWERHIQSLATRQRQEVETLLPSITEE